MSSTLLNADTGHPIGDRHPLPVRIVDHAPSAGVPTTTTPTLPNGVSAILLGANPRRAYLLVRNDGASTVRLSLSGDALSGPDQGLALPVGAFYESNGGYCPTGSITAYQASGAATNAVAVVEGSGDAEAEGGVPTTNAPLVPDRTSTTLLPANAGRKYLLIQNGTDAAIMLSLSGASLSGVAPTSANVGLALPAGESYESSPGFVATGAITAYQASGAATSAIVAVEG